MKKVLVVFLVLFFCSILVANRVHALFSSRAVSSDNTISSGNAGLLIKNNINDDWDSTVDGVNWSNIYPGWSNSFNIYFKNTSASPISLKIQPKIETSDIETEELLDDIKMEISKEDGTHSTGVLSFNDWVSNDDFIDQELAQGAESDPWVVKFSVSNDVGNEFESSSFGFNLIFDGQQVL